MMGRAWSGPRTAPGLLLLWSHVLSLSVSACCLAGTPAFSGRLEQSWTGFFLTPRLEPRVSLEVIGELVIPMFVSVFLLCSQSLQVLCPTFFILIQSLPTPTSIRLPFMSFPEVTLSSFPYPSSTPLTPFDFFISPGVCGNVSHFVLFFYSMTPRCLLPPGHDQM